MKTTSLSLNDRVRHASILKYLSVLPEAMDASEKVISVLSVAVCWKMRFSMQILHAYALIGASL